MRAWVITDGNPDHEARCLGVAEAVAERIERRRVAPRAPWGWLAPFGPIDPQDAPGATSGGPISPRESWPDVAIAAGRKAAAYLREIKRASSARVITVFVGDTLAGSSVADIVAVADGARLKGPNVVACPTRPHRVSAVRLAAARCKPQLTPDAEPGRRVGVMLGSTRRRLTCEDVDRLAAGLRRLVEDGATIAAASSRDAGPRLDLAVKGTAYYLWDRTGSDPHVTMLAQSDALVVMGHDLLGVDEAVATGRPVMVFRPSSLPRATAAALDRLTSIGAVRPFSGRMEGPGPAPLDSTPVIARAVLALAATRAALRPRAERRAEARARETNGPTAR